MATIWTLVEGEEESGQELEKAKWLENNGVGVWSSKEASSSSVVVRVARSIKIKKAKFGNKQFNKGQIFQNENMPNKGQIFLKITSLKFH